MLKRISDKEIAKARLLTSVEIKAIVEEARKFAHGEPDPEAYQLKYLELAGKLSGMKVAQLQLAFSQKECNATVRGMIKEIEAKQEEHTDIYLRSKEWQAFKKRYVK